MGIVGGASWGSLGMDIWDVEFNNWGKYQGDARRYESSSWFRIQNSIWMHALWGALTDTEFKAFIFLVCQISHREHKSGRIKISIGLTSRHSGIPEKHIISTLEKLSDPLLSVITVHARCNHGAKTGTHSAITALQDRTVQTVQMLKSNLSESIRDRIEKAYKTYYPRKVAKTRGIKILMTLINSEKELEEFELAIKKFSEYHRRRQTEERFIPHFSTFAPTWRDCLDPEWGDSGPAKREIAPPPIGAVS
jgi:hypothetical protein